jgi:hypothetical protein
VPIKTELKLYCFAFFDTSRPCCIALLHSVLVKFPALTQRRRNANTVTTIQKLIPVHVISGNYKRDYVIGINPQGRPMMVEVVKMINERRSMIASFL